VQDIGGAGGRIAGILGRAAYGVDPCQYSQEHRPARPAQVTGDDRETRAGGNGWRGYALPAVP